MSDLTKLFIRTDEVLTNRNLVHTLKEYLELLEKVRQFWGRRILWYRGVSNSNFDLTPSTYRESVWKYTIQQEMVLISQFKRKSLPYLLNINYEKWELYQLMQHYSIPTRFLDWTESSLIALLFAVLEIKKCKRPAVWILDPYILNKLVADREQVFFSMNTGDSTDFTITNKYFDLELEDLPNFPIAILPTYLDKRIIAQKSCFTIHGRQKNGFRTLMKNNDFRLIKIVLNDSFLEHIQYELMTTGITYSTIFPDLSGLSQDLKYDMNIK